MQNENSSNSNENAAPMANENSMPPDTQSSGATTAPIAETLSTENGPVSQPETQPVERKGETVRELTPSEFAQKKSPMGAQAVEKTLGDAVKATTQDPVEALRLLHNNFVTERDSFIAFIVAAVIADRQQLTTTLVVNASANSPECFALYRDITRSLHGFDEDVFAASGGAVACGVVVVDHALSAPRTMSVGYAIADANQKLDALDGPAHEGVKVHTMISLCFMPVVK